MEICYFQKGFNYSQDGPGNRLVYHLQGCNLRCPWCSNPEGLSHIGGQCLSVTAMVNQILSCRMMFFDGGGITLTGGEATLQFDPVKLLLTAMHQHGIHTALETNGTHPRLPELYSLVDHLIIDCKHYDPEVHRQVTGTSNAVTHQNIREAIVCGKTPHVRIPLIGGFNASREDAHGFAALFRQLGLSELGTVELLTYHEYGRDKYAKCGMDYTMTEDAFVSPEITSYFTQVLTDAGIALVRT